MLSLRDNQQLLIPEQAPEVILEHFFFIVVIKKKKKAQTEKNDHTYVLPANIFKIIIKQAINYDAVFTVPLIIYSPGMKS